MMENKENNPIREHSGGLRRWSVLVIWLLLPVLLGGGFGYLSWLHGGKLKNQSAIDRRGVSITAKIEALEMKDAGNRKTNSGVWFFIPSSNKSCELIVSYQAKSPERLLNKKIVLEDDAICENHQVGDLVPGRMLPEQPKIMILDEGRSDSLWFGVTFFLFIIFSSVPIFLLLRRLEKTKTEEGGDQELPE